LRWTRTQVQSDERRTMLVMIVQYTPEGEDTQIQLLKLKYNNGGTLVH